MSAADVGRMNLAAVRLALANLEADNEAYAAALPSTPPTALESALVGLLHRAGVDGFGSAAAFAYWLRGRQAELELSLEFFGEPTDLHPNTQ